MFFIDKDDFPLEAEEETYSAAEEFEEEESDFLFEESHDFSGIGLFALPSRHKISNY